MTADTLIDNRARAPRPAHVPAELVREIDMFDLEGIEDGMADAWKRLQTPDMPDLVWTPLTGGHWIAMRGAMVREIYENPDRFSSYVIFLPKEAGEKYTAVPTRMDPPEHTPYRKLLDAVLNPAQVRKMEATVRQTAVELIEGFLARGECDFAREFARPFPVRIFLSMADLPLADVPGLLRLVEDMMRPAGNSPEEMAATFAAANQGFCDYVEPVIQARRGGNGTDLISLLINGTIHGEPMEHEKAVGMILLLLLGGLDTVVNFLSTMMAYLARHPDKVAEIRENELKLQRGVEELFRRFPVVAEARMVAHDMTYHGVSLKQGDMVLAPTPLCGLDEAENPDPMALDWDRKQISHTMFGAGPHRCAGLHLARLEATVTLQEWLKRIPRFALAPGCVPVHQAGIVAGVENVRLVWPAD